MRPSHSFLNRGYQLRAGEYAREAEKATEANGVRESEGCIVPLKLKVQLSGSKPGNAGAGKASEPTRGLTGIQPATEPEILGLSR